MLRKSISAHLPLAYKQSRLREVEQFTHAHTQQIVVSFRIERWRERPLWSLSCHQLRASCWGKKIIIRGIWSVEAPGHCLLFYAFTTWIWAAKYLGLIYELANVLSGWVPNLNGLWIPALLAINDIIIAMLITKLNTQQLKLNNPETNSYI